MISGRRVGVRASVVSAVAMLLAGACGGTTAMDPSDGDTVDAGGWAVREFVFRSPRFETVYERRTEVEPPLNAPSASPVLSLWGGLEALAAGDVEAAELVVDDVAPTFLERGDALIAAIDQPFDTFSGEGIAPTWGSASAQALALAFFDQLDAVTDDEGYDETARLLARGYLLTTQQGGFTRFDDDGAFFDEYPTIDPMFVLQGGALATLALHDHLRINDDPELDTLLAEASAWWLTNLERYDVDSVVLDREIGAPLTALNPPVTQPTAASGQVDVVDLLADVLESPEIAAIAERWAPSEQRIPGAFDTDELPAAALDLADPPVLPVEPGADSVHVEYPGVWTDGEELRALYSAYGDDGRWRIRAATSSDDGVTWDRTGTAIEPSDLGYYGAAFPDVVVDDTTGDLVVVFSAADDVAGYDDVVVVTGPDGDHLGDPVVVAPVGGLDPAIWEDDGVYHVSFTEVIGAGVAIEHYTSADTTTWTREEPLLETGTSIYTQNTFMLSDVRVWALNVSYGAVRGRESVWLFCQDVDAGTLVPLVDGEIDVSDLLQPVWNQFKYGFEIDPSSTVDGDTEVVAFYNGIRRDQGDGNGMIGRTRLDLSEPQFPDECG